MNELIQRYQELITRVASNQLGQMPRSRFDTEDVVRSAFRTFFRRATHGEYIADPKSGLRGLLSLIASAKAAKMIRDAMAGVRDYRLEVQLDERLGQLESDQARRCCSLKAQGQDYAIEVAQVVYAMCEYPEIDPVHRRYLDACMDEELKTKAAIARAMGISERVLDRVQREVQKEIERRMNN